MNLHTIAGHTFDLDRLPASPSVLDVGCRGFDFTAGIRALRPAALIYAMDPDPNIVAPENAGCAFMHFALVGDGRRRSCYATGSTGEGNFLTNMAVHPDYTIIEVPCFDIHFITGLLPPVRKGRWDLVKLDCEGSEFQILENWPGPIATQISVEWHDYQQREKYDDYYYDVLFSEMKEHGYRVVQHELSDISGRGAVGHWDSLLVLED